MSQMQVSRGHHHPAGRAPIGGISPYPRYISLRPARPAGDFPRWRRQTCRFGNAQPGPRHWL